MNLEEKLKDAQDNLADSIESLKDMQRIHEDAVTNQKVLIATCRATLKQWEKIVEKAKELE